MQALLSTLWRADERLDQLSVIPEKEVFLLERAIHARNLFLQHFNALLEAA